jgi:hypothetical protein
MSTARLSPVRLHVAIRRVVRDAQGIYSLGGFKPDLAKRYAEKLIRHLRRLRGVSEVMIAANLGPKHADAVQWARAICSDWHRVNESGFSAERWELVRQLSPLVNELQRTLRAEFVSQLVVADTQLGTEVQRSEGEELAASCAFADLLEFARTRLKGQERAVIEALCDAGGELPIADLAVLGGIGWDDPFQGFKDAQRRLNLKLKPEGWRLQRRNNSGFLVTL